MEDAVKTKKEKNRGPPKRFRTVQGVRRFVATVMDRLDRDDKMDTDKARVLFYGAKILTDLISESALEKRIQALEAKANVPTQPSAVQ